MSYWRLALFVMGVGFVVGGAIATAFGDLETGLVCGTLGALWLLSGYLDYRTAHRAGERQPSRMNALTLQHPIATAAIFAAVVAGLAAIQLRPWYWAFGVFLVVCALLSWSLTFGPTRRNLRRAATSGNRIDPTIYRTVAIVCGVGTVVISAAFRAMGVESGNSAVIGGLLTAVVAMPIATRLSSHQQTGE